MLAVVRLKLSTIGCLTLGLSHGMNRVTLSYCYTGIIIPEDSGSVFCIAKPKSPTVWAYLGVNPLDMHRTPYRVSEENHSRVNNPPCSHHLTITSSSVHHLSHQWTALVLVYHNVT